MQVLFFIIFCLFCRRVIFYQKIGTQTLAFSSAWFTLDGHFRSHTNEREKHMNDKSLAADHGRFSTLSPRYTNTAIALHWIIAVSIIALLILGLTMEDFPKQYQALAYQTHKSLGLTVLILSIVRIIWRLTHKAPPYPESMKLWEKVAAQLVHVGLYVLMLALPLTGWALVSSSPLGYPTIWFGLFEWPALPFFANVEDKKAISDAFGEVHESLAWICIALVALHVGAALKHQFINHDGIMARMLPWLR